MKINGSWINRHNTNLSTLGSIKSVSARPGGVWGGGCILAARSIIRKAALQFKVDGTKYRAIAKDNKSRHNE